MKGDTGLWIDAKQAYIVHLVNDKIEVYVVRSQVEYRKRIGQKNWSSGLKTYRYIAEKETEEQSLWLEKLQFFEAIRNKLRECQTISIFGPDPTKNELKDYLMHHPPFEHKPISIQPLHPIPAKRFAEMVYHYYHKVWI